MILIFGLRDTIFFGILTIILLFITAGTGIIFHYFHKPVFRFHRFFAYLTLAVALIHALLVFLAYF